MDDATLGAALRCLPLTGRPRPACRPLPERVAEVTEVARAACRPAGALAEASHALNKAALIASDCGLPDLARDLCWQHINAYRLPQRPLAVQQARGILEPALNLARLRIRAKEHDKALHLLGDIHQAITTVTDLTIDGEVLPLSRLAVTQEEHRKLREWAWLQHLSEGIRAHVLAARWDEAARHAELHHGIGNHLMEGRQTAIILRCLSRDLAAAGQMLADTAVTEPWERQVATCLAVICAQDQAASRRHITAMTESFQPAEPVPGYATYRAKLGIVTIVLARDADPAEAKRIASTVTTEVIGSSDGYAAREVLAHPTAADLLSVRQRQQLDGTAAASGLAAGSIAEPLHRDLMAAVSTAEHRLHVLLNSQSAACDTPSSRKSTY
jgi:hypothetical protein